MRTTFARRWGATSAAMMLTATLGMPLAAQEPSGFSAPAPVETTHVKIGTKPLAEEEPPPAAPVERVPKTATRAVFVVPPLPKAPVEGVHEENCRQPKEGPQGRWHERWARCMNNLQQCFLGFPEEFERPPVGTSVYVPFANQVDNAEAARMVLYHYDFIDGSAQLNGRGIDQVKKIACLLPETFFPVVIERTPCAAQLDEARRMTVYNELSQGPFPLPLERVVIGPPLADGLTGVEAEIVHRNFLTNVQSGGQGGGATSPPGGPGGLGFSGPGASSGQ